MPDLREQLRSLLQGRVCLVGVGNVEYGDDGFGVRLAEEVKQAWRLPSAPLSDARSPKKFDGLLPPSHEPLTLPSPHRMERGCPQGGRGEAAGFMAGEQVRMEQGASHEPPVCSSRREEAQPAWSEQDQSLVTSAATVQGFKARFGSGNSFPEGEGQGEGEEVFDVIAAGTLPERYVGQLADGAYDTVLFLDAVEFGAAPGSVVLLNSGELTARFPQVSTHKLSLGLLAQLVEAGGRTKAWLLGVQPESLHKTAGLSLPVQRTLHLLTDLLSEVFEVAPASGGALAASRREPPAPLGELSAIFVGETPTNTRETRVLPESFGA